jgi:hypothetical protein
LAACRPANCEEAAARRRGASCGHRNASGRHFGSSEHRLRRDGPGLQGSGVVIGQRARGGCSAGMWLIQERPPGAVVRAWCPKRSEEDVLWVRVAATARRGATGEGRPSRCGTPACPQPGSPARSAAEPWERRSPAVARTPLHSPFAMASENSPHRLTNIFLRWSEQVLRGSLRLDLAGRL